MDLLQILRQAARNQSNVKLLNIYKGLPISYDTNIVSVGVSEIQVPGSRHHIACLYYQGEAYLQGDELPVVIRSTVKSLNLAQDFAILENFEVAQSDIGKRSQIRVEPDDPLVVSIKFKGSAFDFIAPVIDISASGASVFFESYMFPARLSQAGSELTMTIHLPDSVVHKIRKLPPKPRTEGRMVVAARPSPPGGQDGEIVIIAAGRVISVRPDTSLKGYRVSVQLFFKDLGRMVLLQYISQRQSEIIKDLRILSEDLYNRKQK